MPEQIFPGKAEEFARAAQDKFDELVHVSRSLKTHVRYHSKKEGSDGGRKTPDKENVRQTQPKSETIYEPKGESNERVIFVASPFLHGLSADEAFSAAVQLEDHANIIGGKTGKAMRLRANNLLNYASEIE